MLAGIGLFIYQCLDIMDGMQGRRINRDGPLEELFDHGCDSLSTGEEVNYNNNYILHLKFYLSFK